MVAEALLGQSWHGIIAQKIHQSGWRSKQRRTDGTARVGRCREGTHHSVNSVYCAITQSGIASARPEVMLIMVLRRVPSAAIFIVSFL